MMKQKWFDVDRKGLAKILAPRNKIFILYELVQNAWDEDGVRTVNITLRPIPKQAKSELIVEDDAPEGWRDLTDAWTFFAESKKKGDPSKRGLFDVGEKFVLALCEEASIHTTCGAVFFGKNGHRTSRRAQRRSFGSVFRAIVRLTREEYQHICKEVLKLIVPKGIKTVFNGRPLMPRRPVRCFECLLPTIVTAKDGSVRHRSRRATVYIYEPYKNEEGTIYEMGIPVVTTSDRFHVNVGQKIPVNISRDNVPPNYLKMLRIQVANQVADLLTEDDAKSSWIQSATSDERCDAGVLQRVLDLRFGKKRVSYDPSDREANKRAIAANYNLVTGGALTAGQWAKAKQEGLIKPAGKVTPSPKTYDIDGRPEKVITMEQYTSGMLTVANFAEEYGRAIMERDIQVRIVSEPLVSWAANYCDGQLCLNVGKLGHVFFDSFPMNLVEVMDVLLHEFGHEYEKDHLCRKYFSALCMLGARSTFLALKKPGLFP